MNFINITQEQITSFFIADPILCSLGLQDCDLDSLKDKKEFPYYPESYWLGVEVDNELVSIVRTELFTPLSVLCHIYVKSTFHKKGLLRKVKNMVVDHVKNNTEFRSIIVPVPAPCEHVIGPLKSFNFKNVGHMKNAIVWRGNLVDLLWYQLEVK